MDFKELHLETPLDEDVYSEKRAVFDELEDDLEDSSMIRQASFMRDNQETVKKESLVTEVITPSEELNYSIEEKPIISDEVIKETEEYSVDDIEGIPYARDGGRPLHHKEKKEPLYGTTAVAKFLGMSTQAIRNYCDFFEDYLQIQKKESGHRLFTYDDMERLRQLVKLKDEKNFTFEQLREYLKGPENFEVIPESQRFETAIERMEKVFEGSLKSAITYVIESNSKLLEQKDEATHQMFLGLSEQLKSQDAVLTNLIEMIQDEKTTADDRQVKMINELQNSIKERDQRITDLVKITEQQNIKITELETKKQKKFFGLF